MINFIAMHGYAHFIWSAYGCVALGLIAEGVCVYWQRQRIHKQLHLWFDERA